MIYLFFASFILTLILCAVTFSEKEGSLALFLTIFIILCSGLYFAAWNEVRTLKTEAITKGFASMVITNKTNGNTEFQWREGNK